MKAKQLCGDKKWRKISRHGNLKIGAAPMSMNISHETEARLTDEARRQGISVEALLERLMSERGVTAHVAGPAPELPVWHLGRRDIYDDVR
jgi:hypothetical protein